MKDFAAKLGLDVQVREMPQATCTAEESAHASSLAEIQDLSVNDTYFLFWNRSDRSSLKGCSSHP
ncbi:hypothetical protein DC522_17790 [Microvirga sp. KLBC 81]|nr:hypothetical protein DC522_17790 [Microvirga sp. KLBC 81]